MAADSDADSDGNRVCLQILPAQISSILEHTEASTGAYWNLPGPYWNLPGEYVPPKFGTFGLAI